VVRLVHNRSSVGEALKIEVGLDDHRLGPPVIRGLDVVIELVRGVIGLKQVDSRVGEREHDCVEAMTRDVLPSPAEIETLALGREQNFRQLHHEGAVVDVIVVVIGHAFTLSPCSPDKIEPHRVARCGGAL
jgi:hypothetical protein